MRDKIYTGTSIRGCSVLGQEWYSVLCGLKVGAPQWGQGRFPSSSNFKEEK